MEDRFLVTVVAKSKEALLALREYDLDLFRQTSRFTEGEVYSIEGLLSMEETDRLVKDGYEVSVREYAEQDTPARTETVSFQEWLETLLAMASISTATMVFFGQVVSAPAQARAAKLTRALAPSPSLRPATCATCSIPIPTSVVWSMCTPTAN